MDLGGRTLLGTFVHAPAADRVEWLPGALVVLDPAGVVAQVVRSGDAGHATLRDDAERQGRLVRLGGVILPGFVDLHVHAPQYPQLGRALDVPLEVWLQRYTFPLESRYADLAFAARSYRALVGDLLAGGTTTAVYFATIHGPASRLLSDLCIELGQRALVGKVAMDNPDECPASYRDDSAETALAGTRELIDHIAAHPENHGLVRPVITPRFVPSCTDPLLDGLGQLAERCGCHVQTHCSESDWQHGYAQTRFGCSDAEVLDRFGLMTRRTVLAHGPLLSGDDMKRVRRRGAGIAHCPLSNVYFAGAVFPLRAALARGVRVGLGTDIAGGPSASMLDSMRQAVASSRLLESGTDPDVAQARRGRPGSRIGIATAFHLATAGGGEVLDLPIGRFAPGCHFDALRIDPDAPGGTIRLWDEEPGDDMLESILYTASRANIAAVWTAGRQVSPASAG